MKRRRRAGQAALHGPGRAAISGGVQPVLAPHDTGIAAWAAVAGYLVAAALAGAAAGRAAGRERLFWMLAGAALLLLGLNKQLDLQTLLTDWGRTLAREQGWYRERRPVQKAIILLGGGALGLAALWLAWACRRMRAAVWVTLAGLGLLALFVMVRAASFHHIDVALRTPVLGQKLHVVLELAGIAVAGLGAALALRRRAEQPLRRAG